MGAIRSEAELRRLYKEPSERALRKVLDRLDGHCRRLIELSPLVVVATGDAEGRLDATPRGGEPGFVLVQDDGTLLIPDRPGNNRLDALTNLLAKPGIALLFLVPGVDETLRVNGVAEIRDDEELLARFEVDGRRPATVVVVTVREAMLHCAKALMRACLWDEGSKIDRSLLPTLGEMLRQQTGVGEVESQEAMLARYRAILY